MSSVLPTLAAFNNIQYLIALPSHEAEQSEQDLEGVLCDEDTYKKRAWFETYCSQEIRAREAIRQAYLAASAYHHVSSFFGVVEFRYSATKVQGRATVPLAGVLADLNVSFS